MWAVMCVCRHVCHTQARACLSTGWALNRCFVWIFGTAAVLAQGGGGIVLSWVKRRWSVSATRHVFLPRHADKTGAVQHPAPKQLLWLWVLWVQLWVLATFVVAAAALAASSVAQTPVKRPAAPAEMAPPRKASLGWQKKRYFGIAEADRAEMNGVDAFIIFWQSVVATESLPMPLRLYGAVITELGLPCRGFTPPFRGQG